jgi:lipopolysaccharide transport system permease protein
MIGSFWRNRQLIAQMSKREVIGRYRGSVMGVTWSFLNPLLMLIIYTFVFSVVFKARWGAVQGETRADFALILFVGMILHGLMAECLNRAPGLIVSNVNFVKKIIFPLEVLPWVALGSALFHAAVSMGVLVLAQLLINQNIPFTAFWLPVVLLPLALATVGLAWFLAALGVYLRDIGQLTTMVTTILLFTSAVFFPISALPERYQIFMRLNPLALLIEEARKVLIFGQWPDLPLLGFLGILGFLMAWGGFAWFQKSRRGFADVL